MPRDRSFWRNLGIVGLVHVAFVLGLIRWGNGASRPVNAKANVVWMEGGPIAESPAALLASESTPAPDVPTTPSPDPEPDEETPEPSPFDATGDMPLPTPTETPSTTPVATPQATPSPSTTPKPKRRPKREPEETPKRVAKKKEAEKALPKPRRSAVAKASPPTAAKKPSESEAQKEAATSGNGGSGEHGSGAGGASQFSWYASMLHDRFFSEWVQPKTTDMSGAKMSALVKIRIEKDGRISGFTIIRSSGNVVVDESIAAVAKRVTRVDPLPSGLGNSYHEVNINFELSPEQ
jgi:TonB family protein